MMKIEFTGSWPEIRTEIQKFAIEHLNLKFEATTAAAGGNIVRLPDGVAVDLAKLAPAKSETVTVTEAPKKRGRPPAKPKEEKAEGSAAVDVADTEFVTEAAATPKAEAKELTHPDCVSALEKVYNKFGMEKSLEVLSRFGVKRARDLMPKQYREFVNLCQDTAG